MMEKRTAKKLVFLSVAFTTVVTYIYDALNLSKFDAPLTEEQFMRARRLGLFEIQPSEEQLSRARQLQVLDRVSLHCCFVMRN